MKSGWSEGGREGREGKDGGASRWGGRGKMEVLLGKMNISDHVV